MAINKQEIEKYFSVGDVVATAGERSKFTINAIDNNSVRIIISTGNEHVENYQRLSVIEREFSNIDWTRMANSVNETLVQANLPAGNPAYVLGLVKEYLKRKTSHLFSSSHIQTKFELAVEKSKQSSSADRQARLQIASKNPEKITTTSVSFRRNPDVVAEVLERAKGICEKCKNPAPFNRKKDNTPYLEVHHKTRLADDGEDSVKNAIALCPNCHREAHFG